MPSTSRVPLRRSPRRPRLASVLVLAALACWLAATAASAYVVVLKDGTQIVADGPPRRDGQRVIIKMPNGVETSYRTDDVDFERTEELNADGALNATFVGDSVQEIESVEKPQEEETKLSDIVAGRGLSLPEAKTREVREEEAGSALPRTEAGFVDLMRVEREPLADTQVVQEILEYLEGQGHPDVRVYRGVADGQPLLEMPANTESDVFKSIRDAASGLVQIAPRFPDRVQAFDLLMVSERNVRGGQFSMSVEQAQMLVSGRLEPQVYFLRYVEF